MTNQEIHDICKEYKIKNYSINPDGSIDVDDSVDLFNYNLNQIPLKFNKVYGYFDISHNNITSLEGSPKIVTSWFDCSHNKLISLNGFPIEVGSWINCSNNNLKNLIDLFKTNYSIFCENNPIESLEGYNGGYDNLICDNKDGLILKLQRKEKLKILNDL